ncbi:DUF2612 domain-containing protein [Dyadobacter psychrotolerans]|uniref:DUF2612 domain-containing protein n=1 Tax=Dyadobacter psychrotolerans TaxID=2541721 RepID=A0A4R5E1A0_9BACT|nr:DUF2612 domain-containing protein [Dyadobacter psychrotolerans]TDE17725.1 DUF2612 domain-containing protein [Dyadobacter psychrotolerans]
MSDLTEFYKNLLIIQYHNKPKAQATIGLLIDSLLADGIIFDVRDGFDIETAVGAQLDVIGLYVGIDRFYTGQVLTGFFSFINYDEVASPPAGRIGFSNYSDFDTKPGKFLDYDSVLSQGMVLSDDAYRTILKMKIIQNNSNHSHKSIDDSMFAFFGNTVVPDSSGNMVMNYFANGQQSVILTVAIQKNVLPRPMGVRLQYIIEQEEPFFGFATYDGYSDKIMGFSTYADFDTLQGEVLNYDKLMN